MPHTPGPWEAFGWAYDQQWAIAEDRGRKGSAKQGRILAEIRNRAGHDAQEEEIANAKLIAAAPELLEELRAALDMLQVAGKGQESKTVRRWQALIDKAEGREP